MHAARSMTETKINERILSNKLGIVFISHIMYKAGVTNSDPDTLRHRRSGPGIPEHSGMSSQHMYSSSSGNESCEYKVLQSLAAQLKNAIQDDLNDLCLRLHSCNLITNDNYDDCTNLMVPSYQRASQLIRIIQNRVCEHPINYVTFISVLENKPGGYYRSILSLLSDAMKNPDLFINSSTQHVDQSEFQTGHEASAAGGNLNLHKYFWYFVMFTGINIVVNIIIRIFIKDTGMIIAATAPQFLMCFFCFFILALGVILKDEETIKIAAFLYGLIAGIIVFVGITFAVVRFTDAML